ncbi:transducin/WD40 repeat-like superfamily protein [Carex rostrata]
MAGEAKNLKPRRLRGHKAEATCCISSSSRPGFVASSGEDGLICLFDLRCQDVASTIDVAKGPISSLCFKSGNDDLVYASSGTEITCLDVRLGSQSEPVETYNYNKDEINQISFNTKSNFLAAVDDCGDVKIIDTNQKRLCKSLRGAHSSICSSAQFVPWKPWALITGGLDSKLAIWDFSKARKLLVIDYGVPENMNLGQCLNPAFVHSIAVPQTDKILGASYKICAVARGDGIVDVIDLESELRPLTKPRSKNGVGQSANCNESGEKRIHLDYSLGGHTAAVSCVSFSTFGEEGKFLISGGNDSSVKVWNWLNRFSSLQSSSVDDLALSIDIKRKVNWLCTTPTDSENLIVCDTSKVLKVYTV